MWAWRRTWHGFDSSPSLWFQWSTLSFYPRAACGQAPRSTLSQPLLNSTAWAGSPPAFPQGSRQRWAKKTWLCPQWLPSHPFPEVESLPQTAGWAHKTNTAAQLPLALLLFYSRSRLPPRGVRGLTWMLSMELQSIVFSEPLSGHSASVVQTKIKYSLLMWGAREKTEISPWQCLYGGLKHKEICLISQTLCRHAACYYCFYDRNASGLGEIRLGTSRVYV